MRNRYQIVFDLNYRRIYKGFWRGNNQKEILLRWQKLQKMAWWLDDSPRKGYFFTGICHSVHGRGCVSQHALGQTPPPTFTGGCLPQHALGQTPSGPDTHWADTPPWQTPPGQTPPWAARPPGRHPLPPTATAADGTHPTGMNSCLKWEFKVKFQIQ